MTPSQLSLTLLVVSIWGLNFIMVKQVVNHFSPFFAVALRFTAVAALLLPFLPFPRGAIKRLLVVSTLQGVLHFGLFFVGLRCTDAGYAAVVMQLEVVVLALLGVVMLEEKLRPPLLLAAPLALCGILILVADQQGINAEMNSRFIFGTVALCLSGLAWALANVYMKKYLPEVPSTTLVAWVAALAVPQLLVLSLLTEGLPLEQLYTADSGVWGSLAFVVLGSNLIAYGTWYYLLKHCDVSLIGPFIFLTPVIALAAGVLLLGESITTWRVIGALIVLAAMKCSQLDDFPWRKRALRLSELDQNSSVS